MEKKIDTNTKNEKELVKVVAFPGEGLEILSVRELTELRVKVEKYDNYLKYLLRSKINQ